MRRLRKTKKLFLQTAGLNDIFLTIFFGFVQRFIGEMKEIVKMLRRVKAGHAAADGQRNGFAFPFYLGRHYFFPYVVGASEDDAFRIADDIRKKIMSAKIKLKR